MPYKILDDSEIPHEVNTDVQPPNQSVIIEIPANEAQASQLTSNEIAVETQDPFHSHTALLLRQFREAKENVQDLMPDFLDSGARCLFTAANPLGWAMVGGFFGCIGWWFFTYNVVPYPYSILSYLVTPCVGPFGAVIGGIGLGIREGLRQSRPSANLPPEPESPRRGGPF